MWRYWSSLVLLLGMSCRTPPPIPPKPNQPAADPVELPEEPATDPSPDVELPDAEEPHETPSPAPSSPAEGAAAPLDASPNLTSRR